MTDETKPPKEPPPSAEGREAVRRAVMRFRLIAKGHATTGPAPAPAAPAPAKEGT